MTRIRSVIDRILAVLFGNQLMATLTLTALFLGPVLLVIHHSRSRGQLKATVVNRAECVSWPTVDSVAFVFDGSTPFYTVVPFKTSKKQHFKKGDRIVFRCSGDMTYHWTQDAFFLQPWLCGEGNAYTDRQWVSANGMTRASVGECIRRGWDDGEYCPLQGLHAPAMLFGEFGKRRALNLNGDAYIEGSRGKIPLGLDVAFRLTASADSFFIGANVPWRVGNWQRSLATPGPNGRLNVTAVWKRK